MQNFNISPHLFALWWLVKMPKRILLVTGRILAMINNQLSFTTNVRLIFTPLFGDYTFIGRCIGFTIRIFEIFFGLIIMAAIAVFYPILPLIWLALPFVLFFSYGLKVIIGIIALYVFWAVQSRNTPEKTLKQCGDNYNSCVRPSAQKIINRIEINQREAIESLVKIPKIAYLIKRIELDGTDFVEKLASVKFIYSENLLKSAYDFAKEANSSYIAEISLFVALIRSIDKGEIFLAHYNTKLSLIEAGAKWIIKERELKNQMYIWQDDYQGLVLGGFGHGMTGRVTPFLDSMSEDFTKQALGTGYEKYSVRQKDINTLANLLSGSNENILIVGDPGSGKTSLVKGMAFEIMHGTKHKSLWNKRIVSLELSGILSGTKTAGEIADKLKRAIWEAKSSGDIILFIDEIHTLVAGSSSSNPEISTIFNLLEPELASGGIQFVGATTSQNYRKFIEPNGAFSRLFHMYDFGEASYDETFKILEFNIYELERRKNIFITYVAINQCIELSKKLIHERVLPDKAVQIMDRASTYVVGKNKIVNSAVIAEVISEITHVPSSVFSQDEAQKLLKIEDEMRKMVIGQDHALKQIASALKRARAGIRNEGKPIASFLFVGTTGVGKTQTAKALAKTYFGDTKTMVRLDMSEYQQLDSLSRLLGTPDGSTKGILTEAVRSKPFSLILLDEIEKAHSNILLTFLQVLDDGRLTDSSGTTVDFTNSIIIATSNVGTRSIQAVFEQNGNLEQMTEAALKDVRANFAPEFLNRFTGICVFNPLSIDNVRQILDITLKDITKTAEDKHIKVHFNQMLMDELIKRGYNKEWGARPLARLVEDTVETYIAEKLLSGQFLPGSEVDLGMEVFDI